jgi:hypothetical protein
VVDPSDENGIILEIIQVDKCRRMKISSVLFALFLTIMVLSGCGAIESMFRTGVVWFFFLVSMAILIVLVVLNRERS